MAPPPIDVIARSINFLCFPRFLPPFGRNFPSEHEADALSLNRKHARVRSRSVGGRHLFSHSLSLTHSQCQARAGAESSVVSAGESIL